MNNKLIRFILFTLFSLTVAFSQPVPDKKMLKELNLTDAQKEQFEKNSFDKQKKQIELKAKVETSTLELRRLLAAETLDKALIEKKLNEIASQQVAIHMNNLNTWSENNKILNADQQKIWKKILQQHLRMMQGRKMENMQGHMMRNRRLMDNEMAPRMERKDEKQIIKE